MDGPLFFFVPHHPEFLSFIGISQALNWWLVSSPVTVGHCSKQGDHHFEVCGRYLLNPLFLSVTRACRTQCIYSAVSWPGRWELGKGRDGLSPGPLEDGFLQVSSSHGLLLYDTCQLHHPLSWRRKSYITSLDHDPHGARAFHRPPQVPADI